MFWNRCQQLEEQVALYKEVSLAQADRYDQSNQQHYNPGGGGYLVQVLLGMCRWHF